MDQRNDSQSFEERPDSSEEPEVQSADDGAEAADEEPSSPSQPSMAYEFGYNSTIICFDAPCEITIDHVRNVRRLVRRLAGLIPANVMTALLPCIDSLERECASRVPDATRCFGGLYYFPPLDYLTKDGLHTLSEQAIPRANFLNKWYTLGVIHGKFDLQRYKYQFRGDDEDVPFADFAPMAECLEGLTEHEIQNVPILQDLVGLAKEYKGTGSELFFYQFMSEEDDDGFALGSSSGFWESCHGALCGGMWRLRDPQTPQWDRTRRTLTFQKKVIRQYASQTVQAMKILDAFEAAGWPEEIGDPISKLKDPKRLHGAVGTLNLDLKLIEFDVVWSGACVSWKVVTQSQPR